MTKAEIVSEIVRQTGLDKAVVVTTVEKLMDTIEDSLAKGENVYLRGFGTFLIKERAEKLARNITQGTPVIVPAHKIPAFKPAPAFKEKFLK